MNQILHILKYKFFIFVRSEDKFSFEVLFKHIGSGLTYTGFAVGAYFFSQQLIRFLLNDIKIGLFLLHQFISMILFIFFISINIGNIIVSYATLYKSGEIPYLFTKPIEPVKIFVIKFLDNFLYSSSTLLLILFSFLAGYTVYFKLSPISLVLLIFNFIPFMLSAGSLGVIVLLILIKLSNKYGTRNVITLLALTYISLIVIFFEINSPKKIIDEMLQFHQVFIRDLHLVQILPVKLRIMPNNWFAETAYWLVRGNLSYALSFTYLQVVFSIVLFAAAVFIGRRWYFKTWLLSLGFNRNNALGVPGKVSLISFANNSVLNSQWESVIKRDLILFIREPTQVIHFLVLVFLIIVFIISGTGIKYAGIGNFYLQTTIYISFFLFNMLFIITLSLRFIFPLISLEGISYWKVKSSPIHCKTLLISKTIVIGCIIELLSAGLSFFTNYKFGWLMIICSVVITIIASTTIMTVNIGLGGIFRNFKEKNAIRLSSSQGATISFLINIIYILFLIMLLFKPLSEMFFSIVMGQTINYNLFVNPILLIFTVSGIMIYVFTIFAVNAIKQDI